MMMFVNSDIDPLPKVTGGPDHARKLIINKLRLNPHSQQRLSFRNADRCTNIVKISRITSRESTFDVDLL